MLMHTGICSNNRVGVLAKWGIILNLKTFIHQLSRYSGRSNIYVVVATSHPRSLINRNREKNFFAVPFVYSIHIRYFEGGKKKYILCCLLLIFNVLFVNFVLNLFYFYRLWIHHPSNSRRTDVVYFRLFTWDSHHNAHIKIRR